MSANPGHGRMFRRGRSGGTTAREGAQRGRYSGAELLRDSSTSGMPAIRTATPTHAPMPA